MAAATAAPFVARALLADLDGTLVDTEPLYYEAYRAALLNSFGVEYNEAYHVANLHGKPEGLGAALIARDFSLSATPAEILAARDATLFTAFATVQPCRGAARAVALLRGALPAGRLAVATSSKTHLVRTKRQSAPVDALLAQFDAIVCSDSPAMAGRAGKPAPDTFHVAAAALGVAAAECVVFEDSIAGITAGAASGAFVIAVTDSRLPPGAAEAAGARIVLQTLEEFELGMVGL